VARTPDLPSTRRPNPYAGQAIAEFALAVPIFLLLLFGILEGARYAFFSAMVNDAARAGARYAIIHGSQAADGCPSGPPAPNSFACDVPGDNVRQAVTDAAFGTIGGSDLTFGWPGDSRFPLYLAPDGVSEISSNIRGTLVRVRVGYTYRPILPVLPPITVRAEVNLVVNN
jgi:hypothetical protein